MQFLCQQAEETILLHQTFLHISHVVRGLIIRVVNDEKLVLMHVTQFLGLRSFRDLKRGE